MDQTFASCARGADTSKVLDELLAGLPEDAEKADLLFAFYGGAHDPQQVHARLSGYLQSGRIIGGSSSGGVMTRKGAGGADSIAVLALLDQDGDYGLAAAPLGDQAEQTAARLVHEALADCGCAGQLPALIWVYQTPGKEEAVLKGIRTVVDERCPVVGGTAGADDVQAPAFSLLASEGVFEEGLVLAVLMPSRPIGLVLQSGYEPTGQSGVVTAIAPDKNASDPQQCSREILTIDSEPAASVYARWSGLPDWDWDLAEISLMPMATLYEQNAESVLHYQMLSPLAVTADGGLRLLREVSLGERLYAMTGDRQRLIERAGRVVRDARLNLYPNIDVPAGAVMVYCAGCKQAVGEAGLPAVVDLVRSGLNESPFIGAFTFGEQGPVGDYNVHCNLMISAVVFSH